jgi:hypothetical protein
LPLTGNRYYAPLVFHPLFKLFVVFAFIGLLFIGINYSTQLEKVLDISFL